MRLCLEILEEGRPPSIVLDLKKEGNRATRMYLTYQEASYVLKWKSFIGL
jgi:hypothetical protein